MSRTRYRFGESHRPHFLTCTVVAWLPVFTRSEAVKILLDSWTYLQDQGRMTLLDQLEHYKLRHKVDQQHQLWQEGSQPKEIADEEMVRQKLEYLHNNPVKRGYVDDPTHWRYSSARIYAGQPGLIEICTDW